MPVGKNKVCTFGASRVKPAALSVTTSNRVRAACLPAAVLTVKNERSGRDDN